MKKTDPYFHRMAFGRPFATGPRAERTSFTDSDAGNMNLPDGFGENYEKPISENGVFLTRKDMNGLGYLASKNMFYSQSGGLNFYSREMAAKMGGYPKGVVLDYVNGISISKVVSLVEDNMVDFTGGGVTDPDDGIIPGEVDGVNWAYCNSSEEVEPLGDLVGKLPNKLAANNICNPIMSFYATKDGVLDFRGSFDTNPFVTEFVYNDPSGTVSFDIQYFDFIGAFLAIKDTTDDINSVVRGTIVTNQDKLWNWNRENAALNCPTDDGHQQLSNGRNDRIDSIWFDHSLYPDSGKSSDSTLQPTIEKIEPDWNICYAFIRPGIELYIRSAVSGYERSYHIVNPRIVHVQKGHRYTISSFCGTPAGTTEGPGGITLYGDLTKSVVENIDMGVYIV